MARYLATGHAITGLSGSVNSPLGGSTFTKKGVVRNRVVPANPQTASQQEVRAAFLFLTTAWSNLSAAQLAAWEAARSGNAYYLKQDGITGDQRPFASGKDLFIAMNLNWLIGDNSLATPAVTFTLPGTSVGTDAIGFTSYIFDASAGTAILTFTGALALENMVIKATPPVSPGNLKVTSIRSKYRIIMAGGLASPEATGAAYVAVHGAITASTGQKVFWILEGIDVVTGKNRLIQQGSSIIVA